MVSAQYWPPSADSEHLKSKLRCMHALHLEVRLCKNTGELGCSVGVVFEWVQFSQDLLQELHIILPHWRQMDLLQALLLLLTHATHQGDEAKLYTYVHMQLTHARVCFSFIPPDSP